MIAKIVGLSFNPVNNDSIKVGSQVNIVHDSTNKYSSRAIAVVFQSETKKLVSDGREIEIKLEPVHLGHIGEKGNEQHEAIFNALPLSGTIKTMARLSEGETFAKFKPGEITHLEIEFPMPTDNEEGLLKPFNEDVKIKFIKESHRYIHEGKDLISGTRYIKRWMSEFDEDRVAGICAEKYGCKKEDVLGLWSGGSIAALFGTAIHEALEHYEKYKWLGAIVQGQKDLPFNKALPSHPLLRKIVEDFYKQDLPKGEVVVEALLTNVERGLCGFADRLVITGPKRCRVQDYKINIEADKIDSNNKYLGQMAVLPKNKLSKYQMQMSFYARLLELSGWTVEGLDVYVYDSKWKHYELPVLKMDF